MFAFPNMAIDEIKDDVNLIVRFHLRGTMIGIREELEFSMPYSAFFVDHAHHRNRLRIGDDAILHPLEEIRWREILIHELNRAGSCCNFRVVHAAYAHKLVVHLAHALFTRIAAHSVAISCGSLVFGGSTVA